MARALTGRTLPALLLLLSIGQARAQSFEVCALDGLASESLGAAVGLELAARPPQQPAELRIVVDECNARSLRIRLFRGRTLLDARTVPVDDVAPSARLRLLGYVVAEMILLAESTPTEPEPNPGHDPPANAATPTAMPEAPPASGDADALPTARDATPGATADAGDHARDEGSVASQPALADARPERWALDRERPVEVTVDGGIRWYTEPGSHLATIRLTVAVERLLLEGRYTFGPVRRDARPLAPNGRPQPDCPFHVPTLAIGFRHAFRFGDDALVLDALGYAGAVWTPADDGYRDSFEGRARYGMGGLEARLGLDVGLGPVRATLTFEVGYAQGRRVRYEDPLRPAPLRDVSGPFVGATLGLGFAKLAR